MKKRQPLIFTADFETRNSPFDIEQNKTSVWLWDICSCNGSYYHRTGTDIQSFFETLKDISPCVVYMHNLKFDGNFIFYYLLKNGYTYKRGKKLSEGEFNCLITETKVFYTIQFTFGTKNKQAKKTVEIRDSAKKIIGSVESIAKAYDLPILKTNIDHDLYRDENYKPTDDEIKYVQHDTEIIARAMDIHTEQKMTSLTASSDSLKKYKQTIKETNFVKLFPVLSTEYDTDIRKSYKGGISWLNPNFKEKTIDSVVDVWDENSEYPSKMATELLPYGEPLKVNVRSRIKPSPVYPLYVQHIFVDLKVKLNHPPCIVEKKFTNNSFISDTKGEMIELWMTNIDIDMMYEHYDIYDIQFCEGYLFNGSRNLFKKYILPLYEQKAQSKSKSLTSILKIFLNSLYGKFGTSPRAVERYPELDPDTDLLRFPKSHDKLKDPIYIPVASFITAYARKDLCKAITDNFDNFIYCDTDSVHLLRSEKNPLLDIDQKRLGAWKLEKTYYKSLYIHQKTYIGSLDNENKIIDIKVAGLPKSMKSMVNFDNFKTGSTYHGKLIPKQAIGGVLLIRKDFTIK